MRISWNFTLTIASALATLLPCAAQTQQVRSVPNVLIDHVPIDYDDSARMELAKRRAADYEAQRFQEDMHAVAVLWNDFTAEYLEKHAFNVKKARALHKALRRLEAKLPE